MRALISVLVFIAATPALAGELAVFDAQGHYQGRIEPSQDGREIDRFNAQGRYQRAPDGWGVFGADGTFRGRIEQEPGVRQDAEGQ